MPERRGAVALFACAIAAGVIGIYTLPGLLVVVLVGVLLWASGTLWLRTVDLRGWRTSNPDNDFSAAARPLAAGESFDNAAKLTFAPNVPIAETLCARLRSNGIEAFVKRVPSFPALSAVTNDFDPAEVWVAEHDLERANDLLGTAHSERVRHPPV